ncbi:hypothetical protein [Zunongwangia profunda]|nr:hypothetical protein [Zunongwangia profunda]MAS69983.1 hypothetical protein [Zunongwangia sp.]HCV81958.1 hypothetical protein [Zunongwangia profunda]|tara:strand:- start:4351 stop:4761 length:411 start_codon:yes stop_codon:yes gene_type:complete
MESSKVEPGRNLETYRILFIIKAVLNLLICFVGLMYMVMGVAFTNADIPDDFPFNYFNLIFFIFGGLFILFSIIITVLTFLAAKYLREHKNATFIIVVSVINCLTGILGIVLGILTIIEIQKPEVSALFEANKIKN